MSPVRIQRQRTKGWRMPEGAIYVGRPTLWGNPWTARELTWIEPRRRRAVAVSRYREEMSHRGLLSDYGFVASDARVDEVARHMDAVGARTMGEYAAVVLRGKDLVCWCPLEDPAGNRVPCHADVLLKLANPDELAADADAARRGGGGVAGGDVPRLPPLRRLLPRGQGLPPVRDPAPARALGGYDEPQALQLRPRRDVAGDSGRDGVSAREGEGVNFPLDSIHASVYGTPITTKGDHNGEAIDSLHSSDRHAVTLTEAARLLGVTPDNLRRQIHLGKLRAAKKGRDWHVTKGEVERYGKENRRER